MKLMHIINIFTVLILINKTIFVLSKEDCSEYDKLKEFKKYLGKPNIFYDEDRNLVLKVAIYTGKTNRVIDSGLASVGVQLKENTNSELVNFLSTVLSIGQGYFLVHPEQEPLKKIVKITNNAARPYEVIDKLISALEITAKEEPEALKKNYPIENSYHPEESCDEDVTRVYDWRDKVL